MASPRYPNSAQRRTDQACIFDRRDHFDTLQPNCGWQRVCCRLDRCRISSLPTSPVQDDDTLRDIRRWSVSTSLRPLLCASLLVRWLSLCRAFCSCFLSTQLHQPHPMRHILPCLLQAGIKMQRLRFGSVGWGKKRLSCTGMLVETRPEWQET